MFGRKPNLFKDYEGCISDLISETDLIDQMNTLTDTVYPALAKVTGRYNKLMESRHAKSKLITQPFPVGAVVRRKNLLRRRKGEELWVGPYTIAKAHGQGSYTLMDNTGELFPSKVSQKHLKRIPDTAYVDGTEVDRILDHRGVGDNREYFVSWVDFPGEDSSWVNINDFNTLKIVTDYHNDTVPTRRAKPGESCEKKLKHQEIPDARLATMGSKTRGKRQARLPARFRE
jgi:hypothetical protein